MNGPKRSQPKKRTGTDTGGSKTGGYEKRSGPDTGGSKTGGYEKRSGTGTGGSKTGGYEKRSGTDTGGSKTSGYEKRSGTDTGGSKTGGYEKRSGPDTGGSETRGNVRRSGTKTNRYQGRSKVHNKSQSRWKQVAPQEETWASESERLQKIMAGAGLCSRRGAEALIARGLVTVDGVTVTELGRKVNPAKEKIMVEGRPLPPPQRLHYYMFHKPAGYLTTLADPQGRATIKPFLDTLPVRVFPVGRLDMDVEGLLILTNDGNLAKALMHPSSQIPKVYRVKVAGIPNLDDLDDLRHSHLWLGDCPAAPAGAELLKSAEDRAWILLTLTEGRHHQVKRMCSAIGHPVLKLKRISYAGLELGTLRREIIRPLNYYEVRHLQEMVQNPPDFDAELY